MSEDVIQKPSRKDRLRAGAAVRERFVENHIKMGIATQIRALRVDRDMTQEQLAQKIGISQQALCRSENFDYGKHSLRTLRKIAAAFDVALTVRFVPFGELLDWENNLAANVAPPAFDKDPTFAVESSPCDLPARTEAWHSELSHFRVKSFHKPDDLSSVRVKWQKIDDLSPFRVEAHRIAATDAIVLVYDTAREWSSGSDETYGQLLQWVQRGESHTVRIKSADVSDELQPAS